MQSHDKLLHETEAKRSSLDRIPFFLGVNVAASNSALVKRLKLSYLHILASRSAILSLGSAAKFALRRTAMDYC